MRRPTWILAAVIVVAVVATFVIKANNHPYTLTVVMPAALLTRRRMVPYTASHDWISVAHAA